MSFCSKIYSNGIYVKHVKHLLTGRKPYQAVSNIMALDTIPKVVKELR